MNVYILYIYISLNAYTCMYILHTSINIYVHVHTWTYVYINSWTCTYMSVPCSDTYILFCHILSRVVGFQTVCQAARTPEWCISCLVLNLTAYSWLRLLGVANFKLGFTGKTCTVVPSTFKLAIMVRLEKADILACGTPNQHHPASAMIRAIIS